MDWLLIFFCTFFVRGNYSKISIIIPIFNVETKLSRSLGSILNQSFKQLEIICIDDGSVDNSLAIVKNFSEIDKRIIVIPQENCGASCARNVGIEKASGEYIAFFDSDDVVEWNTYEVAYEEAKKFNGDVVVFRGCCYHRTGKQAYTYGPSTNEVLHGIDSARFFFSWSCNVALHNKLYKTSMLKDNKVLFDPFVKVQEDLLFNLALVPFVDTVCCINRIFYHYYPSSVKRYMYRPPFIKSVRQCLIKVKEDIERKDWVGKNRLLTELDEYVSAEIRRKRMKSKKIIKKTKRRKK